ncbi:MAG: AMP-binding protein [Deltaproteobacteria bacterium]|nr:MAG: AMP-binding protein [Deltaproteobacteria bacterium]
MTGCEARVVNANDQDVPAGEVGETVLKHESLMRGYWNSPELTRKALRGGCTILRT